MNFLNIKVNSCWIKNSSIDLGFLLRKFKDLPTPTLLYIENFSYGGQYFYPWHEPQKTECGVEIPPSKGTIVCGWHEHHHPTEYTESVLAHEFRHHWQAYNRDWETGIGSAGWHNLEKKYGYNKAIVRYFLDDPMELDALIFENQISPRCEHHKWILDRCGLYNKI